MHKTLDEHKILNVSTVREDVYKLYVNKEFRGYISESSILALKPNKEVLSEHLYPGYLFTKSLYLIPGNDYITDYKLRNNFNFIDTFTGKEITSKDNTELEYLGNVPFNHYIIDSKDHLYTNEYGILLHNGSSKKQSSNTNWNSSGTSDSLDRYRPDYDKAHDELNNAYQNSKDKGIYEGDRVINDYNDQTKNAIKGQGDLVGQNEHTLNDLEDMRSGNVSPYFQQQLDYQNRKLSNKLLNSNALSGYGTSDNSRIVGREISNQTNEALNKQWNDTQNRRLQANQLEQQAAANQSNILNNSMNAGGKLDALKQMQLDAAREKFEEGRDYDYDNLSKYINGLKQIDAGFGQTNQSGSSNTTNQIKGSGLDSLISGIGGGASILGSLGKAGSILGGWFSDESIKKFIKDTKSKTVDGIPIKTFKYKYNDLPKGTYKGVIAQDVEKVRPDAVKTDPETGIKSVNYDLLNTVLKKVKK